ncbi:MAG: PLDc_N domain-containing protein [Anaerolineae bacterium]|nr:PLDc_N domain-containing protein [Anaerolineae bacterium]
MSDETTAESGKKFAASLPRIAVNLAHMALLSLAIRDLRKRPDDEINGNKRLWYGIVFIQLIGPIAYFTIGRKREAAALPTPAPDVEMVDTARLAEA